MRAMAAHAQAHKSVHVEYVKYSVAMNVVVMVGTDADVEQHCSSVMQSSVVRRIAEVGRGMQGKPPQELTCPSSRRRRPCHPYAR